MPLYTYKHPATGEEEDVLQGMNEEHKYEKDGVEWERVLYAPRIAIDTKVDAFSSSDFKNKACEKKGSYGDLLDQSAELAAKRVEKLGYDPVKAKTDAEYSALRGGRKPLENAVKEIVI
jgi:predicted nucleic acid-binding Zn ribbon protein